MHGLCPSGHGDVLDTPYGVQTGLSIDLTGTLHPNYWCSIVANSPQEVPAISLTHPLARLGSDDLRDQRHACALFDGADEADSTLIPFIIAGVALNERVVSIVDGRRRDDYLQTLERAGLDTESALDDGSLRVDTWADTYLRDGRFEPSRMVEVIRATMVEGRALGFTRTRLISTMEWALE